VRIRSSLVVAGAIGVTSTACLPSDTRPTPGRLDVTATSDDALENGISPTVDGWTIVYERYLLGLGRVSLDGDGCNNYTDEGGYSRILNVLRPGAQKVSIIYALGTCDFGFRVAHPSSRAALGKGVAEADKTFMRTPGTDAIVKGPRGLSAYVEGRAEKNDVVKHFAWAIRQDFDFASCRVDQDGTIEAGFVLHSGDAKTADITIRGEALFQDNVADEEAKLRFEPFARADDEFGDGDGNVTLDELAKLPLGTFISELGGLDAGLDASDGNTGWPALVDDSGVDGGAWKSFGDFVYYGLVPRVARFRGTGMCKTRATNGGGEF
jgi:hypothetical protein